MFVYSHKFTQDTYHIVSSHRHCCYPAFRSLRRGSESHAMAWYSVRACLPTVGASLSARVAFVYSQVSLFTVTNSWFRVMVQSLWWLHSPSSPPLSTFQTFRAVSGLYIPPFPIHRPSSVPLIKYYFLAARARVHTEGAKMRRRGRCESTLTEGAFPPSEWNLLEVKSSHIFLVGIIMALLFVSTIAIIHWCCCVVVGSVCGV